MRFKYIIFVLIAIFVGNKLFDIHKGLFPNIIKEKYSRDYYDYLSVLETYGINAELDEYLVDDYKLYKLKIQKHILDFFTEDGYAINLKYTNNEDENLELNSRIYVSGIESDKEMIKLNRYIYNFNQSISIDDVVVMIDYVPKHGNDYYKYMYYKFSYNGLYYYGYLSVACEDSCNIEVNKIDMVNFLADYIKETYQFIY